MQFTYQHRDYCERLVLISSGGLGPDLSWILRILSAPGAELVLPVVAPRPVVNVGNKLGSWLTSAGIHSPHAGELWNAYSSLSDGQTRQAFLRTLRSVVDYRGQAVSAINKLHGLCPSGGVKEFGRRFPRRRASLKEGTHVRVEEDIACAAVAGRD